MAVVDTHPPHFSAGLAVEKASLVDILERHVADLDLCTPSKGDGHHLDIKFRGFEVKTVKLELNRRKGRSDSVVSGDWVRVLEGQE